MSAVPNQSQQDNPESWMSRAVVTFNGAKDTHIHSRKPYKTITLWEIFSSPPAAADKNSAPAIVPSMYREFDARKHEVQRENGQYVAYTADVDRGNPDGERVMELVRKFFGPDAAVLVYSTASSTAELRKWRAIIPSATVLSFDEWNDGQNALYDYLEENGLTLDRCLARSAQPVYLPNVPTKARDADGEPLYYVRLCEMGEAATAPADAVQAVRNKRLEKEANQKRVNAERLERMQQRQTSGFSSTIDAFNASHDVEAMMERYGYVTNGRDWRSPNQSGTTYAVRACDDGGWISLSESDADAGVGQKCHVGCFGDAFDLFKFFEHGNDMKTALNAAGELLTVTDTETGEVITLNEQWKRDRRAATVRLRIGSGVEVVVGDTSPRIHPLSLANAVRLDTLNTVEPEFILDGLVQSGFVIFAGMHGVGKTSALVPLAAKVAHLCPDDDPLRPTLRRHVIYIAEDTSQVASVLAALRANGSFDGFTDEDVGGWFHLINAHRMRVEEIVRVADEYIGLTHTNEVDGVTYDAKPLVVLDTAASSISLEQENDNSEASAAVALFKQSFDGIPIMLASHISKGLKRSDVKNFSARGASAWEADSNQVLYLVEDENLGKRVIEIESAKHRFTAAAACIVVEREDVEVGMRDVFGRDKRVVVTVGRPVAASRADIAEKRDAAKASKAEEGRERTRLAVVAEMDRAAANGVPVNRTHLRDSIPHRGDDVKAVINQMINDGWIVEVNCHSIIQPWMVLANSRQSTFLVKLTPGERDEYAATGGLPDRAKLVPDGWMRPSVAKTRRVVRSASTGTNET